MRWPFLGPLGLMVCVYFARDASRPPFKKTARLLPEAPCRQFGGVRPSVIPLMFPYVIQNQSVSCFPWSKIGKVSLHVDLATFDILYYTQAGPGFFARSVLMMSHPGEPVDDIQHLIDCFDIEHVLHFNRYFAFCGDITVQQTFSIVMKSLDFQHLLSQLQVQSDVIILLNSKPFRLTALLFSKQRWRQRPGE